MNSKFNRNIEEFEEYNESDVEEDEEEGEAEEDPDDKNLRFGDFFKIISNYFF